MPVQEVVLQVPDPNGREVEAVRREAGAVLASVAPEATLRVDTAPGVGGVTTDGERVSPPRYRREPQEIARQLAWTLFWSLLERMPVLERPACVACHGTADRSALTRLESALGVTVATAAGAPLPAGLEPGPRLAIGGLLTPVLDESDGDRRGSRSAAGVLRRAAARLVGEEHALALLARVERHRPLVAAAMRQRFSVPLLATVIRQLADEGVPLTQPRLLCEALLATTSVCPPTLDAYIVFEPPVLGLAWSSAPLSELPPHAWTQRAREGLKAHNASRYSGQSLEFRMQWGLETYAPQWTIAVGLVDPDVERRIADGSLGADEQAALLHALEGELDPADRASAPREVPLLVGASSRFALWQLVRSVFPDLSVLAYQELAPEANIQPLFRLSL